MRRPASRLRGKAPAECPNQAVDFAETVSDSRENVPESEVAGIDALYKQAGLVRSRRVQPAEVARRFQRAAPEELSPVPAHPTIGANGVEWLPVPGWGKTSWLWHGFSTRGGGVSRAYCGDDAPGELNLGFTADDDRESVLHNRRLLAEAVTGSPGTPLVTVRQIHSSVLVVGGRDSCADRAAKRGGSRANPNDKGPSLHPTNAKLSVGTPVLGTPANYPSDKDLSLGTPAKGDGLMTAEPGVLLGIQTADCIPVLVADRKRRAVAAFHAGWRGTVKRIVENGIGRMRLEFGSRPEDLVAAIGPGIGACCYAVGEEVLSEFESQFNYGLELFREVYDTDPVRMKYPMLFLSQLAPGHTPMGPGLHLDLVEANRRQLLSAGLSAGTIQVVAACTNCHPEMFFSHRASKGRCGRMMSVIGIAE
jgi:polyphenol oxidase